MNITSRKRKSLTNAVPSSDGRPAEQTYHVLPFVVGVDNYLDDASFANLALCISDAQSVDTAFSQMLDPSDLVLLLDPSRDELLSTMENVAKLSRARPLLIVFYFAGHSYQDDEPFYLCPNSRRRLDVPLEYFI